MFSRSLTEKLLFSLFLIVLSANCSMPTFDFKEFLVMVDDQIEKQKVERQEKFAYISPPTVGLENYQKDRHGQYFITCESRNDSAELETMTIRCFLRPNHARVACMYTYDYEQDLATQGCFDLRSEDSTCQDTCEIDVNQHSTPPGVPKAKLTVGFCCCYKNDCNSENVLKRKSAYDQFIAKEETRRHHHTRRDTRLRLATDRGKNMISYWNVPNTKF